MREFVLRPDGVPSRPFALGLTAVPRWRYPLGVAVLAAAYYGAAQFGYALDLSGPVASIVWLPVGVAIAFLYLGGLRYWPGVLIGDVLANDYSTLPVGSALGQTCGNMLEVLVAAILLERLCRRSPLASVRSLGYLLVALGAGVAVSATIGSLSLRLGGVTTQANVGDVWRTWWLGDFVGALVVVPLALAWYGPLDLPRRPARIVEAVAALVAVVVLSEISSRSHRPVVYVVFPALIWAALRFGPRGATLAIAIAVGITIS